MATTVTETTELAVREEQSHELAVTPRQAMAAKEIEGAIIVARRFPRNEDSSRSRVIASCARATFAGQTIWKYPRGKKDIQGPTVKLAREMARCWGNIRYGFDVVHDDEESRTIQAWAWDVETNTRRSQDATFKKLVYRTTGGWVKPDERDLRELTNKHGETAVRNCLLHVMPPDLAEDAMVASRKTLTLNAAADPDKARKLVADGFSKIGVTVEDLEVYLDHPLRQMTPDEVADLRAIWKSISDGNSKWVEYVKKEPDDKPANVQGGATVDDLVKPAPEPPLNPPTLAEINAAQAQLCEQFAEQLANANLPVEVLAIRDQIAAALRAKSITDSQYAELGELEIAAKERLNKAT